MAFGFGFGLTRGGSTGGPFATAALDLNFLGGTLDSKVTFTRTGSVATYVNSSGYITTAGANVPRFDYDPATLALRGLLIEQSATNSLLYSEDFSNTAWTSVSTNVLVTTDVTTAPNNTTTADKLIATTTNGQHWISQGSTVSTTAYSFSIYAKAAEETVLSTVQGINSAGATFNLSTGTVDTSGGGLYGTATITAVSNGWYRCVWSFISSANTTVVVQLRQKASSFTGNNVDGLYLWGAQLEVGSFPTSYIPTTTATVTRGTDVAVLSGTNFSSWFSSTAGTFYAEGAPITATPTAFSFIAEGYTGSAAGTFTIGTTGTNTFGLNARIGGASNNSNESIPLTFTAGGVIKGSVSYDSTPSSGLVLNGSVITASATSTAATATSLYIGSRGGSTNIWNGWVRQVSFFNSKLTNAQMQTLTT